MDPDTISRAADGEPDALNAVFDRNLGPLLAFIRMKAGGVVAARESAMDIAQSVCREALQDIDQFEPRGETAFRSWLFLQATRKILNRYRHHHRAKRDVDREIAQVPASDGEIQSLLASYATVSTPTRIAAAREEVSRLETAIRSLPEDQRDAVMMSRVMGLGYEEIAAQMGRSASSVRGLAARGLATLAARLTE